MTSNAFAWGGQTNKHQMAWAHRWGRTSQPATNYHQHQQPLPIAALRVNGSSVRWASRPSDERQQAYLHRDKALPSNKEVWLWIAGGSAGEMSQGSIDAAPSFQKKSLFQNVMISSEEISKPTPAYSFKPTDSERELQAFESEELQRLTGAEDAGQEETRPFPQISTLVQKKTNKCCTLSHRW